MRIARLEAAARTALMAVDGVAAARARATLDGCETGTNERALLPCVTGQAGLSAQASPTGAGEAAWRKLVAIVPGSGEAQIAGAMLASARRDPESRALALQRVRVSYLLAGYSRRSGLWRCWYVAHHWSDASPTTRDGVVREAVWLARLGYWDRQRVKETLGPTPAWIPIAVRLAAVAAAGAPTR